MQKTAQKSQQKSVSGYPRIYALAEKGVNAAYVRIAFWAIGAGDFNASFRVTFQRAEIAAKITEIDAALAEGAGIFDAGDGHIYEISAELFGELRGILSSYYAVQGGSDAHVVRGGVSTPIKPKASARADGGNAPEASSPSETAGSVGRQFNEELRTKNEERDRCIAQAIAVRAEPFNGSGTAAEELAGEVARIVGEELRKAMVPVLSEVDAIIALVKECAAELAAISKQFITRASAESIGSALREELEPVLDALDDIGAMLSELLAERGFDHAPKQPLGWRKCTVENPLGGVIRTKRGRTSVVVGRRKVS